MQKLYTKDKTLTSTHARDPWYVYFLLKTAMYLSFYSSAFHCQSLTTSIPVTRRWCLYRIDSLHYGQVIFPQYFQSPEIKVSPFIQIPRAIRIQVIMSYAKTHLYNNYHSKYKDKFEKLTLFLSFILPWLLDWLIQMFDLKGTW